MAASCVTGGKPAKVRGAETCTPSPQKCTPSHLQASITALLKFKFPAGTKAFAYLMDTFGLKERAAKHRLSNSVSYTIEELQALIQGEDGLDYLEALMADAEPVWWTWTKWVAEQAKLERIAADALQKKMQLEAQLPMTAPRKDSRNVKNLRSNLSGAKAALGVLLPNSNSASSGAMAAAQAAPAKRAYAGRSR